MCADHREIVLNLVLLMEHQEFSGCTLGTWESGKSGERGNFICGTDFVF